MTDREKEIKRLMYEKMELIKQAKKELKNLRIELESLQGQKRLTRNKGKK